MIASWVVRTLRPGWVNGDGNGNGNGNGHGNGNGVGLTRPSRVTPIGHGDSLSPLVDPDDVLAFEFGRARRYERALSIVVVAPISWPDEHDDDRAPESRLPTVLPLLTAAGLREVLRETDIMCYEPLEGCFVLGLTESESPAAQRALERVQVLFRSRLRIELAVGVAQFPNDGLTLEDLIEAARLQAESQRTGEFGRPISPLPGQPPAARPPQPVASASETASHAMESK